MPGSLLTPHDALSDRSEASYCSADSRASAKKVSFNKAVRVKQYPWTPDDNYLPDNGTTHLSLPSRRFWFKVYKVKSTAQNGDQTGTAYNGHYSQQHPTNSWKEDTVEDTYDSLAPIVEDDGTDHDDKNHLNGNGELNDEYSYHRSHVRDIVSKFSDETAVPLKRENGYGKSGGPSESSRKTTVKNPVLNGFKAVLAKSQTKIKGEKKDTGTRSAPQNDVIRSERFNYRAVSPTKQLGVSNLNYDRNSNTENFADANDKSALPIKIPRAESPRRGKDNIERFSMRYKTHQRRSRSTDDTTQNGPNVRQLMSSDKSVSTDDLDSSALHQKSGLPWLSRANKDKSTQCNGTLIRSKPLTAYGTPRLSRSSISNFVKREEPGDKKGHLAPQNGNFKVKTDTPVNGSRSYSLNGRSTEDSNLRGVRNNSESCPRNSTSDARRNLSQIITKPRIAMNVHRSQNNKTTSPAVSREPYATKSQEPTISDSTAEHYTVLSDVKSTGLFERGRGLSVVPEGRPLSRQHWSNTPLTERRANSWERSVRPTAATVGYQSGRYFLSQTSRGDDSLQNGFETNRNVTGAVVPPRARERNRAMTSTRDGNRSLFHTSESTQNNKEISSAVSPLKNGSVPVRGDNNAHESMIDWSLSGFQLGPPTVDRGLVSDSECFVHQRTPLLMYIPGVSHHEKPAVEEDRMSGISGISRADMDDDLRPLASATNSYVFNRRNSMPKDCNKSWVKWKVGGRPSRQP